jgi:hypothetical protein
MQEIKVFTEGGLNWDTELHLLPAHDWTNAINMRMAASDEQQEGAAINIEGNVRIGSYDYDAGINICIGSYPDEFRSVIIAMICNSNNYDQIIEINPETGVITPIFKNLTWTNSIDITQFEPQTKIHSIDIIHRADDEGDLLFWTDGVTRPRKINILKGKNFGTATGYPSPIIYDYTTVVKRPPDSPLATWLSDLDRATNNVRAKLFQFQVRFVYDDFEKSTWSGWSNFTIPVTPFDPDRDSDPTINNYISVVIPTGGSNVKKIEFGVRQNIASLWGDLSLLETFNKEELSIADDSTYTYSFYNDTSGIPQTPADTNQIFDYVPTAAGSQAAVNGNTLAYGNITEGLNFPDPVDVTMSSYENELVVINNGDDILGYKMSGKYKFGLVYFDEYKRTDGVHNAQVITPTKTMEVNTSFYISDNLGSDNYNVFIPKISAAIFHQPPIWAKTFKWVRTNCLTSSKYLYYVASNINTGDLDNIYMRLDPITDSITREGQLALSYDFVEGDRIRFVRRMKAFLGPSAENLQIDLQIINVVKDPTIINTTYSGSFIKIRKNTEATTAIQGDPAAYLVEIYSPSNINNNSFYFDFDKEYQILNPGTPTRYHQGSAGDQTSTLPARFFFTRNGDVYYRKREKMTFGNSVVNVTLTNIPISDPNFSDIYSSAVNGNGRPYIVDRDAKEQNLPSDIRFGGAYIQDTYVNKTNNFPAANIIDNCDRSFGTIKRLTVRDRQLRVFQELKCGWIPIQQNVLNTTNGSSIVSQSDQLLNNIQYYLGDFGIGNAPCSLATKNFADYFHDTNRSVICRLSRDGVTPISIVAKMNRFAITEDVKYKDTDYTGFLPPFVDDVPGKANIYGVFDTKNNTYISAYQEIATYEAGPVRTVINSPKTLSWDEVRNRFISPDLRFYPEWMTCIKNDLVTFKDGIPYIHNDKINRSRFYGVDQDWGIEVVFNDKFAIKKTFQTVDVLSNVIIPMPEISTSLIEPDGSAPQQSNLIAGDFRLLESHYHASLLRDSNSPGGVINGDTLKGSYIKCLLKVSSAQSLVSLYSVGMSYIISQKNNQ